MQFLFRNRWIAIVWAVSVLGSVLLMHQQGIGNTGGSSGAGLFASKSENPKAAKPGIKKVRLREDGSVDDGFSSDDEVSLTEEERQARAERMSAATSAAKQAAAKALTEGAEPTN